MDTRFFRLCAVSSILLSSILFIPTFSIISTDKEKSMNFWLFLTGFLIFAITGLIILSFAMRKAYILSFFSGMPWKLEKENIKFIENKPNQEAISQSDLQTAPTNDALHIISKRRNIPRHALIYRNSPSGDKTFQAAEFKQFPTYGETIILKEEFSDTLKQLMKLRHVNLVDFFGIQCNDDNNFTFFYTLVERTTLERFFVKIKIEENIKTAFKSSFMRDIVDGLDYLHRSPVKYHGHLLPSNCLIDTNWILKLSLFGVSNIISEQYVNFKFEKPINSKKANILLEEYVCLPPEHLSEYDRSGTYWPRILTGSAQGDIYSLGMIMYSIVMEVDPFEDALELIGKHQVGVVEVSLSSFIKEILYFNRIPNLSEPKPEKNILEFCKRCWNRVPTERPKLSEAYNEIRNAYKNENGLLIDQLAKLTELNAVRLEEEVTERTKELNEMQEKTAKWINEMLPPSIANALKNGITPAPRSFESATVMFIQVWNFNDFIKKVRAQQMFKFLNDIFEEFDKITEKYDAYKVETIGANYMVASGVPKENGNEHVFEIANIGIEIRDIASTIKSEVIPSFEVIFQIGFHAGPIAAGVIGLKGVRYCLFGDTVNFASRMQTNCPVGQIQTSEKTARMLMERRGKYILERKGLVYVKGKGDVMAYWLLGHQEHPLSYNYHLSDN